MSLMTTVYDGKDDTLTEWKKGIPRPVSKEPLWHELVRLLPIPRCKTPSEHVPIVQSHSAYDYSARPELEDRFLSLTGQEMLSFHRRRCLLSRWYPPRQPLGYSLPDHRNTRLASGRNKFSSTYWGAVDRLSARYGNTIEWHSQQPESLIENAT